MALRCRRAWRRSIARAGERERLQADFAARAYFFDRRRQRLAGRARAAQSAICGDFARHRGTQGPSALTTGPIAEQIVAAAQRNPRGGSLTLADLQAVMRAPDRASVRRLSRLPRLHHGAAELGRGGDCNSRPLRARAAAAGGRKQCRRLGRVPVGEPARVCRPRSLHRRRPIRADARARDGRGRLSRSARALDRSRARARARRSGHAGRPGIIRPMGPRSRRRRRHHAFLRRRPMGQRCRDDGDGRRRLRLAAHGGGLLAQQPADGFFVRADAERTARCERRRASQSARARRCRRRS